MPLNRNKSVQGATQDTSNFIYLMPFYRLLHAAMSSVFNMTRTMPL